MSNFQVYSSSAGSGKTYTLALNFISIAIKGNRYKFKNYFKRILAITFTNKAAVEMKSRVLQYLELLSNRKDEDNILSFIKKETKLDAEEVFRRSSIIYQNILHNYSDLAILTIDKFTTKIVRSFSKELGLAYNFDLEIDNYKIIQPVIALLISRISIEETDLTKLLIDFAYSKIDVGKSNNIEKDLELFSEELFKEDNQQYFEKSKLSISEFEEIREHLNQNISKNKKKINQLSKKVTSYFSRNSLTSKHFIRGTFFNHFTKNLLSDEFKKWIPSSNLQQNIINDKWYSETSTSVIKSQIEDSKSNLLIFFNELMSIIIEYNSFQAVLKNIYSLSILNELTKQIKLFKIDQNIEHISVFNKKIHQIVNEQPSSFLYERIGERYNHFLIDEFQDTSTLQWQNFLPLITDSLDYGKSIIVGDGKQSIYRWRGGAIEQFLNLPRVFGGKNLPFKTEWEKKLKSHFVLNNLQKNFRSRKEIVDFNNLFYAKIKKLLNPSLQNIYENHNQRSNLQNKSGYVHIQLFDDKKNDYKLLVLKKIFDEINTLVSKFNYSYRDITILCNSRGRVSMVAEYLSENKIPVISNEGLLLKKSEAVNLIISFLTYLSNNENTIAKSSIIIYIQKNILQSYSIHSLNLMLMTRKGFYKILELSGVSINEERLIQMPLYQMVEQLILDLNINMGVYVQFFLDFILKYTQIYSSSLSSFLVFWEEEKSKESIVLSDGVDAVNVMTIHKSKGLAFNIVMIPFNWEDKKNTQQSWVNISQQFNTKLNFALVPFNLSSEYSFYKNEYFREKQLSLLDNINKLYVATTRARERLYIFSKAFPAKPKNNFIEKGYLNSFLYFFTNSYPFTLGNYHFKHVTKIKPNKTFQIKKIKSVNWREVISLKHSAEQIWDVETNDRKKDWGKLVHQALSEINYLDEKNKVLNRLYLTGKCDKAQLAKLNKQLKELLNNPDVAYFFNDEWKVQNEREILDEQGKTYIPDRLLFNKNSKKVVVIDYKTGDEKKTHINQILQYTNVLNKMGYNHVDPVLIYTSKKNKVKNLCNLI